MDSRTLEALLQIPVKSQKVEVLQDLKLACYALIGKVVDKLVNIELDNLKPYYRCYLD